MTYTLAIDQGTHATRAIIFDQRGAILDQSEQTIQLNRLDDDRVEQDADEILQSVLSVLNGLGKDKLAATSSCALATQRSTIVAWDKITGQALAPAISWQDRRSWQDLDQYANQSIQIKRITGLPLSAHYSVGKFRWLLAHHPAVKQAASEQRLCLGTLASYLMFHLLQQPNNCIDHCNAQRSLLFDLNQLNWSETLLELFQIPRSLLPECKPVCHDYGRLKGYDIPLRCVTGDQNAAIFAHGALAEDAALINIGTGAFILSACQKPVPDSPLLSGLAMSSRHRHQYLIEGTVNGAGAALSWAQLQWPVDNLFEQLPAWLDEQQQPAVFINTVGGLGSPWWKKTVAPYFISDEEQSLSSRYVAIIESMVFLLLDNLQRLQQLQVIQQLQLSGGLSRLDGLCQKLSDLSGLPVMRFHQPEATARG
ncbi:MAG: FGGY family carbohydrate kinase, partial [Gammaproteobacteria bacterium]|nr:FGGY family carbohydrate kinase [Gammaproteobacteria bacterium]